jgi:hypothetical protein
MAQVQIFLNKLNNYTHFHGNLAEFYINSQRFSFVTVWIQKCAMQTLLCLHQTVAKSGNKLHSVLLAAQNLSLLSKIIIY